MSVAGQDVRAATPANAPESVLARVAEVVVPTTPDTTEFCDSSQEEWGCLAALMVENSMFTKLSKGKRPSSLLARSKLSDAVRVKSRIFICFEKEEDAGPADHQADPKGMKATLREKLAGSMVGRTLYVIPFSTGPPGGLTSQLSVRITDSPYVMCSVRIMTRMGTAAMDLIAKDKPWVPAVHFVGVPFAEGAIDDN